MRVDLVCEGGGTRLRRSPPLGRLELLAILAHPQRRFVSGGGTSRRSSEAQGDADGGIGPSQPRRGREK